MASYSRRILSGFSALIVEGISMLPEVQGKGVFGDITGRILDSERLICLRTQSPHMYRALEKISKEVYPNGGHRCKVLDKVRRDFASYLNCKIEGEGIIRGYYGGLFYGKEPTHCRVSGFFKEDLKMDLSKGDAVLVIGIR